MGRRTPVDGLLLTLLFSLLLVSQAKAEKTSAHLRIILVASESQAEEVLSGIRQGKSFISLAKERSIDEKSARRYGDLGEVPLKGLDQPIREAVARLEEGEVSGVIKLSENRYALVQKVDLSHYRKGAKAFRSGDFREAEAHLLKHIEINPDAVKARVMMGRIYEGIKEPGKAETMYKEALFYGPEHEDAYLYLGKLYLDKGLYRKAGDLYTEGLKYFPNKALFKAGIKTADKHIPRVKTADKRILPPSEKKKTERSHLPLRLILSAGEKEAEEVLYEILKGRPFASLAKERSIDEKSREEYGYLGEVDVVSLDAPLQEALTGMDEGATSGVIRLGGDRYAIIHVVNFRNYKEGEKAFASGDFKAAETLLLKHLELNPDAAKARVMLGKIYEDRREDAKAEEMYRKAIQLEPKVVLVYERLARLYITKGQYLKAREVYTEGLKSIPDSPVLEEGAEMTDILLIQEGIRTR